MRNRFIERFRQLEIDIVNEQRRIPINSCLKVYFGITTDKHFRISFISSVRPFEFVSTKEVQVTQGKESENVYWTCFDLIHDSAKEVFFIFCESLIESIENIEDEFAALYALKDRFFSWKLLLKTKGQMTYEAYQGLFGELYFLSEYLLKKTDIEKAINAWVGPEGYSKDFSIDDTWFEIKTIGTSSTSVRINSLDQLDSDVKGFLVIIVVERMSDEFNINLCSVSSIYHSILDRINNHELREKFVNKVLSYGFMDKDSTINNYKFEVKRISYYGVDNNFPKLTKNNIKISAISQVTYDLVISAIEKYKEKC